MAGISKLASIASAGKSQICQRNVNCLLFRSKTNPFLFQTRESHGRTMFIRPGKFYTKKYFDMLHFHVVLASMPFLLFVGYQNLFVGPAKLTDLPDGYEPRHWEYYRSPIKRFLAKYWYEPAEKAYEVSLHELYVESCKQKMRALEKKVRERMVDKQDYKAWYYIPVPKETQEMKQEFLEKQGNPGYDSRFVKK